MVPKASWNVPTQSATTRRLYYRVPGDAAFLSDKASVIRQAKKDTSYINQTWELQDGSDNTFTTSCRPHVRAVSGDSKVIKWLRTVRTKFEFRVGQKYG